MHEIGLYHPRIHFPSDAWVKAAALYWTKIARITPAGYTPKDSDTVRELNDGIGDFIIDIQPIDEDVEEAEKSQFLWFISQNQQVLRDRYGTASADHPARHIVADPRSIDEAHIDLGVAPYTGVLTPGKFDPCIGEELVETGLAVVVEESREEYLLMHPALARVYMSVLAGVIARRDRLQTLTDDGEEYAAGNGWTAERMASVLLQRPLTAKPPQPRHDDTAGTPSSIGLLTVTALIPKDIERVPARKIVWLRKRFATRFNAFRSAADAAADEISAILQDVRDPAVLRAYLDQEMEERFLTPLQELRRELRQARIDAALATFTVKYDMPSLAGLIGGEALTHRPWLAGGSAVAFGLLGRIRNMREQTAAIVEKSPVSYLMLIEDTLTARSRLQQATEQIRKIGGPF